MSRFGELPDDLETEHNRPLYAPKDLEDLSRLLLRIANQGGAFRHEGGTASRFFVKGFNVGAKAIAVLTDNARRQYLLIQNNSTGFMYVGLGSKPAKENGYRIRPGGVFEPHVVPSSAIFVLGVADKANVDFNQAGIIIEG